MKIIPQNVLISFRDTLFIYVSIGCCLLDPLNSGGINIVGTEINLPKRTERNYILSFLCIVYTFSLIPLF